MPLTIHFISGLPRSGSTLLAAILRQNPSFHASISSPVSEIFLQLVRSMSLSELALFVSEEQRRHILKSMVESYYAEHLGNRVIFDTSRAWCNLLPALADLFPSARVLCCLRSPAWILDSIERVVQQNRYQASKMYAGDAWTNVYLRAESASKGGLLGTAFNALRQAWFGEYAQRLVGIRYDSLVSNRPTSSGGCTKFWDSRPSRTTSSM